MRSLATTIIVIAALAFARTATAQPVFPHPGGGPANTPSAEQQSALITKLTPDQVVQLLNAASIPSESWKTTNTTNGLWRSSGERTSTAVSLRIIVINDGGCRTLEIFANFGKSPSVNQAWLNAWNRSKVSVKAYRSSNNLIFSYDLPLFTGVTADYIIYFCEILQSGCR